MNSAHRQVAFSGFDPAKDDLTDVIGLRWGDKFDRLLGKEGDAARYRQRLTRDVVERWRNLYSHGGFEKGHGATIYLHTPGVGAVPVGLTSVRSSPPFLVHPGSERNRHHPGLRALRRDRHLADDSASRGDAVD